MIEIKTRKQLGLIESTNIPAHCIYIGRLPSPFSKPEINYECIVDIFICSGYFILHQNDQKNGAPDDMPEQFEMPLDGVKWMIDAIEKGFERPPSAGGIPKNTFHMDTLINGERLRLMYGVCVGGEGVGGYTVVNASRSGYILPRYSQEFSITVDIWNQVGRDFFKALQKRIESGEFN